MHTPSQHIRRYKHKRLDPPTHPVDEHYILLLKTHYMFTTTDVCNVVNPTRPEPMMMMMMKMM
jgi:hypothetical protein